MWRSVLSALAVTPASMLVGLSLGFTGAGLDVMRNTVKDDGRKVSLPVDSKLWVFTDSNVATLFSALFCLGAVIGSFLTYPIADRFGRKAALFFTAPLFASGYVTIAVGSPDWLLIIARIVTGLGTGAASVAVPTYIGEIAPTSIRGILGTFHQLSIAFGAAIAYCFAAFIRTDGDGFYVDSPSTPTGNSIFVQWRTVAFLYLIWCGLMAVNALLVSQSPRWLAGRGRLDEAVATLRWLRSDQVTEADIESLNKIAASQSTTTGTSRAKVTTADLYNNRRQLVVGLGLHLGQQLAAIHAFNFYLSTMLQAVALDSRKMVALVAMIIKFSGNVVLAMFIDRVGRRGPMLVGAFGMGASCLLMGVGYYLYFEKNENHTWIFVSGPMLYCLFYSFGVGAIPWLIMAELYTDKIRAIASSLASATNWLGCFVITFTFDYLVDAIDYSGVMWLYAAFSFGLFFFTFFMLPETRGKSFEDIKVFFDTGRFPQLPLAKQLSTSAIDPGVGLSTLRSAPAEGDAARI